MMTFARDGMLCWDRLTDSEIFFYVLGQKNHVSFHDGWDWTMISVEQPRIWFSEEEEE